MYEKKMGMASSGEDYHLAPPEGESYNRYMSEIPQKAPNCLTCTHFKVSWDPAFPRSCTVFGIKTKNMPSAEVFAATGIHCPSYERKPGLK